MHGVVVYLKCAFVIEGFATCVAAHPTFARGRSHAANAVHLGVKGSVADAFGVLILYKLVMDLVVAQAVGLLSLVLRLLLTLMLLLRLLLRRLLLTLLAGGAGGDGRGPVAGLCFRFDIVHGSHRSTARALACTEGRQRHLRLAGLYWFPLIWQAWFAESEGGVLHRQAIGGQAKHGGRYWVDILEGEEEG